MKSNNIGMIVAVEIDAVLNKYANIKKIESSPYEIWQLDMGNSQVYVLKSGAGEIFASASTQYLILKYNVKAIINFGIVGALVEDLKKENLCLIKNIVHYDYDISQVDKVNIGRYLEYPNEYLEADQELINIAKECYPDLKLVTCASADKFVADETKKQQLHSQFGAEICEMESAGILLTCDRNKVPCLFIKAIADTLFGGANEYWKNLKKSSEIALDIVDKIIKRI